MPSELGERTLVATVEVVSPLEPSGESPSSMDEASLLRRLRASCVGRMVPKVRDWRPNMSREALCGMLTYDSPKARSLVPSVRGFGSLDAECCAVASVPSCCGCVPLLEALVVAGEN